MTGNPLNCGCDVKWILNSNFQWENLLRGSTCSNGKTLPEVLVLDLGIFFLELCLKVNMTVLERLCPSDTCPHYHSELGLPFIMESGDLKSPGYPHQYPSRYNSAETIAVSSGKIIITFDSFATEAGYDKVTVTDADGTILLNGHSGGLPPNPITSHTNKVFVRFVTDGSNSDSGWSLVWESVP